MEQGSGKGLEFHASQRVGTLSKEQDLIARIKDLTKKMIKKKFNSKEMECTLRKSLQKYTWIAAKMGPNFIKNIFEN